VPLKIIFSKEASSKAARFAALKIIIIFQTDKKTTLKTITKPRQKI